MKLTFKIKPRVLKGKTKQELIDRLTDGYILANTRDHVGFMSGKFKLAYNIQKFRGKRHRSKGKGWIQTTKTYWQANVYYLPLGFPINIEQRNKYFVYSARS